MSTEGGAEPVRARNGKELYFRKANRMIAARVNTDGGFSAERSTLLFKGEYDLVLANSDSDVAADRRFLMMRTPPGSAPRTVVVVLNWFEELKRQAAPSVKWRAPLYPLAAVNNPESPCESGPFCGTLR